MKRLGESSQYMLRSYLLRCNPVLETIILKKYGSPLKYYRSQQLGGAKDTITIDYNSEAFEFHQAEENYWVLYDRDDRDCVAIAIDPETREAYINNINADTTRCGNTILTNQGSHLFKITLQFLKELKERLKVDTILLKDNAEKYCPGQSKRIGLAVFLTLLTGHTWYGRYGFRPQEKESRRSYRHNYRIMSTTKLRDIDFGAIIRDLSGKIRRDQYDYIIDKYNGLKEDNPLVKDLMKAIFNQSSYDFICSVFPLIVERLVHMLGLRFLNIINSVYMMAI